MKVYVGKNLHELKVWAPAAPVFEDFFPEVMGENYADCWTLFVTFGYEEVICKTIDAVRVCPEHAVHRIGRSIRISDRGEVIETKTPIDMYLTMAGVQRIQT